MPADLAQAGLQMSPPDLLFVVFYRHRVGVDRADDIDLTSRAGNTCINKVTLKQQEVLFE